MPFVQKKIRAFIDNKNIDTGFWVVFIFLIVISVVSIFSSGSYLVYRHNSILAPIRTHIVFLFIGVVVAFFIQFLPSLFIRRFAYVLWSISILGLLLLLCHFLPFIRPVNGAYRWIFIGPFSFQPAELAKFSLIIMVADMLTFIRSERDAKKWFFRTLFVSAITCLLIFVNNLSTAILLGSVICLMWFLSGVPERYLFGTLAAAVIFLGGAYGIIKFAFVDSNRPVPAHLSRMVTHINRLSNAFAEEPSTYLVTDENYQKTWAMVAVANGGKTPVGVGPGNSVARDFLPLAFEEYNFSIITEEFGIMGAIFVIFLYITILFRACLISNRFYDYGAVLMVLGLALMISLQAIVSMMVSTGMGVVTGQPLPMLCRGGTSIVTTSAYFGVFMAVSREQKLRKQKFEETREKNMKEMQIIDIER